MYALYIYIYNILLIILTLMYILLIGVAFTANRRKDVFNLRSDDTQ